MSKKQIERQIAQWEIKHAVRTENLGPNAPESQAALDKIRELNEQWLVLDAQEIVFGE